MRRLVAGAFLVLLAAAPAWADPSDLATKIDNEVMSPFCPGVTLDSCPSEAAVKLRLAIQEKAAAGWSERRILGWLRAEYGSNIAAQPPRSGIGLLAWLLPAAAVAGGGALIWALLRRWTARRDAERRRMPAHPEYDARLEAELAEMRQRS